MVSTNGVELDAALDALRGKANAQEVAARQEKLEKAVAEVCLCVGGGEGLWWWCSVLIVLDVCIHLDAHLHPSLRACKHATTGSDRIGSYLYTPTYTHLHPHQVYEWAGARELVERLEESSRAASARVQGMEAALACKVDKVRSPLSVSTRLFIA